tara:strand:+ start:3245 stop:3433 length:189 start_codon:yes stop_codon:yes gene_type:complete
MKLKIISKGFPELTKVVNEATQEQVEGIQSVEWHMGVDGLSRAMIKLVDIQTDIESDFDENA